MSFDMSCSSIKVHRVKIVLLLKKLKFRISDVILQTLTYLDLQYYFFLNAYCCVCVCVCVNVFLVYSIVLNYHELCV